MANDSKKQQVMAEIERLTAQVDQLPEGDQRQQLVAQIANLNVEYQAED
jgi:outer membrane murein-binding lipoprotein Lpp